MAVAVIIVGMILTFAMLGIMDKWQLSIEEMLSTLFVCVFALVIGLGVKEWTM